ncbi:lysosome-associated membrane glycoprotein 1 [Megachile rotundata]|uniref:lysosome-associated membrane glycoprotein 1 n=1 Tax=Megachile rotundata TaxID=143995 RepID=UPI003FD27F60
MMKLLLFLCFTAVHVLGENTKEVLIDNSNSPSRLLALNDTEVHPEAKPSSKKTIDLLESILPSLDMNENKTKADKTKPDKTKSDETKSTTVINVSSSMATESHTEVTTPDFTTVPSTTTDRLTEQTLTTTVNPPTMVNVANVAALSAAKPGKWIVNGTDNKICIVVQMSVEFNISYVNNNHTISYKTFDMPVSNATTTGNGTCGALEQNLTLAWSSKNQTNNGSMTMHFLRNVNESYYSFHHLEVMLPAADFQNSSLNETMILVHNASHITVGLSNSYRCLKQQILYLKRNNTNETAGYLTITDLQFQAFRTDNSTTFSVAKDCAFDTPDAVPIAVGCALAGLVIIVLFAYLVGRRRSEARGYVSM